VVGPDASPAFPGHHLPIQGGPLAFLANRPSPHASSAAAHGSTEENKWDSSIFLTEDCSTAANDNTLKDAHLADSSTKVFSHNLHTFVSSYYVEDFCDSTLPIEHHPDFVNVGAHLELGEESDSIVSSDYNDVDNISASSGEGDDPSGAAIFSGFRPQPLLDDARMINPSQLQPADEALLSLIIENHLPQEMYNKVLDWAHFAHISNYNIPSASDYRTALHRMHAKYVNVCGVPPQVRL